MKALNDFREFVLRGNVVDLAVGIIIGAAFGAIVTAIVQDLITPLIGIFFKANFGGLKFTINGSDFLVGDVINKLVDFLIIAAVVFFLIVRPVNALIARTKKEPPAPESDTRPCPYCTSIISKLATRCPYCTSEVEPLAIADVGAETPA
jgi:large conductance mechanosensitive channel